MNDYYVYIFLNSLKPGHFKYADDLTFTHQPFYVGRGINNRIECSEKYDKNNKIKTSIIDYIHKNDMNVISLKIKECMTLEESYDYEIYTINKIGRIIHKSGPLSNIEDGGNTFQNRIRPVLQYDIKGNFIKEYKSIGEAVASTNIKNISYCCSGVRNLAGKYIWRYKQSSDFPTIIPVDFLDRMVHYGNYETPVLQFDINKNFICRFESIKEASDSTGCSSPRIVDVCKGNRKHTKNFIWIYADKK